MNTNPTPVDQIGQVAGQITQHGTDPVLLGFFMVVGVIVVVLLVWLLRSFQAQQQATLKDYREQLDTTRSSHTVEMTRQGEMFERSLKQVVDSNNTNVEKITERLEALTQHQEHMDDRLVRVETMLTPATPKPKTRRTT